MEGLQKKEFFKKIIKKKEIEQKEITTKFLTGIKRADKHAK